MLNVITRLPPLLAVIFACVMVWIDNMGFRFDIPNPYSAYLSGVCILLAILLDTSALYAFWQARTTINPVLPGKASKIVTSGPYRLSRNPMYVGLALLLCGLLFYLGNLLLVIFIPVFIALANKLFILREEQVLEDKFGSEYRQYKDTVRRWL